MDLSDKALKNKDYVTAKKILEKVILTNKDIPEVYNNLGIILHNYKNYSEAINHFKKAILEDSNFFLAYSNLGLSYKSLWEF